MITCGWCGTHYSTWQNRCDSCGGPMPPLPGRELGVAPPPIPRRLPSGFAFRVRWSRNVLVLVGTVFFVLASFLFVSLLSAKTWGALFPLLFMLIGLSLFRVGWREASCTLRSFIRGTAVAGEVVSVSLDRTQSLNKQHPWKMIYHFPVEGTLHEGSITSFDSTLASRGAGQPLWILYVPEDPTQNTLYPPLR